MIGGGDPFYLKFWIKLTVLERNRRFSISFRSRYPVSPRWTSYVAPKPYKEWLENAKCPKFEQ